MQPGLDQEDISQEGDTAFCPSTHQNRCTNLEMERNLLKQPGPRTVASYLQTHLPLPLEVKRQARPGTKRRRERFLWETGQTPTAAFGATSRWPSAPIAPPPYCKNSAHKRPDGSHSRCPRRKSPSLLARQKKKPSWQGLLSNSTAKL